MPTEPNQNAHELLKRYARARREQAGPPADLDPGTRARLQAEVARTFNASSAAARPKSYAVGVSNLWLRLVLGGACAALLIGVATVLLRWDKDSEVRLAQRQEIDSFFAQSPDRLPMAGTERNPLADRVQRFELGVPGQARTDSVAAADGAANPEPSAAVKASAESPKPFDDLALANTDRQLQLAPGTASNGPLLAQGLTPPAAPAEVALKTESLGLTQPSSLLAAAPPAESETSAASLGGGVSAKQAAPAQPGLRFQQNPSAYRPNLNSPPAARILSAFEIQRSGAYVKIVDADGSVYTGTSAPASGAGQPFAFQALGTNRTLKELVVFKGQFEPGPGETGFTGALAVAQSASERVLTTSQTTTPVQAFDQKPKTGGQSALGQTVSAFSPSQARIVGRASVGGSTQIKIEAQQVGP